MRQNGGICWFEKELIILAYGIHDILLGANLFCLFHLEFRKTFKISARSDNISLWVIKAVGMT